MTLLERLERLATSYSNGTLIFCFLLVCTFMLFLAYWAFTPRPDVVRQLGIPAEIIGYVSLAATTPLMIYYAAMIWVKRRMARRT
jgi:hypothetical protein